MADNNVRRDDDHREEGRGRGWLGMIIRFVVAAVVLMVTAAVTPGFSSMGFGTALLAALIIAAMDYVIQKLFRIDASPFGRGLTGFILSAVIIYLTQFLVPDMEINLFGAIIAALIIGVIDAIIPAHVF
ncbi:MAG: phage holin family protein [Caldicoprobacterales bacterium]|nr:phage holin family protein [Clostridiales bacterium]